LDDDVAEATQRRRNAATRRLIKAVSQKLTESHCNNREKKRNQRGLFYCHMTVLDDSINCPPLSRKKVIPSYS
jgi:hypothetical protein